MDCIFSTSQSGRKQVLFSHYYPWLSLCTDIIIFEKFFFFLAGCLKGCNRLVLFYGVSRWVHTSLVSRPQVYFNLTSDMNGSNSNLSSLLCSRGNVSCSKEPKYTSKSSSTHPYRRTYALSKQFQEIECQSNALFDEISEHTRHAHYFRTTCYGTSFVDLAEAKLFFVYVACFVVHSGIYLTEKHGFFV